MTVIAAHYHDLMLTLGTLMFAVGGAILIAFALLRRPAPPRRLTGAAALRASTTYVITTLAPHPGPDAATVIRPRRYRGERRHAAR